MNNLYIPASKASPLIDFKTSGSLRIEGRSMMEDPRKFYKPIFQWLKNSTGLTKVILDIKLEYFNTASSKLVLELLNRIITVCDKNLEIIWHYEEGDDDMFDSGKYFEQLLDRKFQYQPFTEEISF